MKDTSRLEGKETLGHIWYKLTLEWVKHFARFFLAKCLFKKLTIVSVALIKNCDVRWLQIECLD